MTAAKFSPGPWRVQRAQTPPHRLMIYDARGSSVGLLFERDPLLQNDQTAHANAHLVEQAPVLPDVVLALRGGIQALFDARDGKTLHDAAELAEAAIEQADAVLAKAARHD